MSCDPLPFGQNNPPVGNPYGSACRLDIPYPSVSHESVPSLIDNLVNALYGKITKSVVNRQVIWNVPCDPNNTASILGISRNSGEGLMCYFIRAFGQFVNPNASPVQKGELVIQTLNNTNLVFKYQGSDGIVRSSTLTLS